MNQISILSLLLIIPIASRNRNGKVGRWVKETENKMSETVHITCNIGLKSFQIAVDGKLPMAPHIMDNFKFLEG